MPAPNFDSLPASAKEEIQFWSQELTLKGKHPEQIVCRLDASRRREAFPPLLAEPLLPMLKARLQLTRPIACLEIGSGPLSTLAWGVQQGLMTVTGIDVLAAHYAALLARHGVSDYPVRPVQGSGEQLPDMFPPASFDLAYANNALDHTDDAPQVFANMVALVRVGGLLVLQHHLNEGTHREWSDSHNWNLDLGSRGLAITGRDGTVVQLGQRNDLELVYLNYRSYSLDGWIDVVYQRIASTG